LRIKRILTRLKQFFAEKIAKTQKLMYIPPLPYFTTLLILSALKQRK